MYDIIRIPSDDERAREKKCRRVPTSQDEYNAPIFLRKVIYRALTAKLVKGDLLMLQAADTFIRL